MLFRLIYQSRNLLRRPSGTSGLLKIVRSAERNNLALSLTGALLFDKNAFIQVLEGERSKVTQLFLRISQDERHSEINLIEALAVPDRRFHNWSMAVIEGSSASSLGQEFISSEHLLHTMGQQLAETTGTIEVSVPVW